MTTIVTVVVIRHTFIGLNLLSVNQLSSLIKDVQTTLNKIIVTIQVVDTKIQNLSTLETEKTNAVTGGFIRNLENKEVK